MAYFGDLQDYIGGKPVAGRVLCVDAGGRVVQSDSQQTTLGLFGVTPVSQARAVVTLSTAITSVDAANSATVMAALNSLGLTINSLATHLANYGLLSTG